ncbi:MAG: hypothetical protein ACRBI6_14435 [Acidimicrobiales bacterium]
MNPGGAPPGLGLDADRFVAAHGFRCALAADVVLVYDLSLAPPAPWYRRVAGRIDRQRHPFRAVLHGDDQVDLVVSAGPGAPVAGVTIELLATFGARRVVSVGVAAGDHRTRPATSYLLDRAADPLGHLPCPGGEPTPRSGPLFDRLRDGVEGVASAHTTLWPFRVDPVDVLSPPNGSTTSSPTVIEMEARALFAVGDLTGVDVQAVVVTSDHFDHRGRWHLGDTAATRTALERTLRHARQSLVSTQP